MAGTAVEPMKEIQKFMWSLGDYGQIARITEVASGKLAEACGIAIEVWDQARLEAERCRSLLAVARGSMSYNLI